MILTTFSKEEKIINTFMGKKGYTSRPNKTIVGSCATSIP
jgi:hypothetical protein